MQFFDFANSVIDRRTDRNRLSVPVPPRFPISGGYKELTITPELQYRPDKIAYDEYGDETLTWILDMANNFRHGFKEYVNGVTIKVPFPETLRQMGIQ